MSPRAERVASVPSAPRLRVPRALVTPAGGRGCRLQLASGRDPSLCTAWVLALVGLALEPLPGGIAEDWSKLSPTTFLSFLIYLCLWDSGRIHEEESRS